MVKVAKQRWYRTRDLVPNRKFPGSRSTLYVWVEKGYFPRPDKAANGFTNVWPVEVVDDWERKQLARREVPT